MVFGPATSLPSALLMPQVPLTRETPVPPEPQVRGTQPRPASAAGCWSWSSLSARLCGLGAFQGSPPLGPARMQGSCRERTGCPLRGNTGLWSLSYEQELTTPLHITAGRGYAECVRLLLRRGAAVDAAPGGRTALHAACAAASAACVRLLLAAGADPEAVSEDGHRPLHLCRSSDSIECVQQLLQRGASVNSQTEEEMDTALHVAARHGLAEHVQLLLHHGAEVEVRNKEGQTPLNAACAQQHQPQDMDRYYRVCQLLVQSGARINAEDRDRQHPLHLACKNANAQIAELLLAHGANVNVMNYGGNTALHNILQVAAYKREHRPELVVRALLNHGAVRIWPGSLLKVLRCCHSCPRVIEVLVNSYSHVRVSEDWLAAVPAEVVQTSLLAAPGSLHTQDPPGGPAASGPVPAASAKCPAPVPAARLRGRSLLGVAVPVLLCLSVQVFHLCQCSLCFCSYPLPLTHSCLATSAPCAKPAAVSQSQAALCSASRTCFGVFCLSILIQTDPRLTKGGMGIRELCGTRSKDTAWITGLVVGYQFPYPKSRYSSLY
ncbi:ankyrin repeat and SOCS box protein 10 isoform X3 [Passer montanus]|uniref:ankyrin repeat and SOCS box protein 10 isoform X3 n=1 Tax=Passer montanus TaxID=9160 RepID=UPI001961DE9A|nr:ankyrin repeat and SOCS box protein 10 isoform X3 [Passer montanus]